MMIRKFLILLMLLLGGAAWGQGSAAGDFSGQAFSKSALTPSLPGAPAFAQEALPQITDTPRKGGVKHVFLSLVLPGAGEWALGHKGAAKFFLGTEATLWLGFAASRVYLNVLQNDLEAYAARHAGVIDTDGKADQYWIDVGLAPSIYDFNAEKLLERDLEGTYPEGESFDWTWDSEANRITYAGRRLDRVDWKRNSTLIVGALVLNRLVSAIDVIRLIKKENSEAEQARKSFLNLRYAADRYQGKVVNLHFSWML